MQVRHPIGQFRQQPGELASVPALPGTDPDPEIEPDRVERIRVRVVVLSTNAGRPPRRGTCCGCAGPATTRTWGVATGEGAVSLRCRRGADRSPATVRLRHVPAGNDNRVYRAAADGSAVVMRAAAAKALRAATKDDPLAAALDAIHSDVSPSPNSVRDFLLQARRHLT
jgi:hypothetical protein